MLVTSQAKIVISKDDIEQNNPFVSDEYEVIGHLKHAAEKQLKKDISTIRDVREIVDEVTKLEDIPKFVLVFPEGKFIYKNKS